MARFDDDDDDLDIPPGAADDESSGRDDPDPRDLASDDFITCPHCGKFIHEDSVACPYCKMNVLDPLRPGINPLWFVITAIFVAVFIAIFWGVLGPF